MPPKIADASPTVELHPILPAEPCHQILENRLTNIKKLFLDALVKEYLKLN